MVCSYYLANIPIFLFISLRYEFIDMQVQTYSFISTEIIELLIEITIIDTIRFRISS